jgi:hypothetical protein
MNVPVELTEEQAWIVVIALSHWAAKEGQDGKYDDGRKTLAIAMLINGEVQKAYAQKMSELAERSGAV